MAKIGVIHYNFPGFSFEDFLKFAADTGYRFVELQIGDVWDEEKDNQPEKNTEKVREQLASYGLRASALAAGNNFIQTEEEGIRKQVERMKHIASLTKILDPEAVIRSEGGWAKEEDVPKEKWLDSMYECFRRCVGFAEELQVKFAIDNHGYVTNDADLLYALLKKIDNKWFGTNMDTMNYRWYGHSVEKCKQIYEIMAPYAMHTHMKDGFDSRENYKGAALGEGEIDLLYAVNCLRKAGYDGAFTAEYEGPEPQGGVGYAKCYKWLKANL
ncbi:MAG: sugar phosphate isomerase/epimerase [Armatimonadetes bacterium]|nr:sugar phosphate isomerase/epimerase [Armatimonadota bacterium]